MITWCVVKIALGRFCVRLVCEFSLVTSGQVSDEKRSLNSL